MLPLVIALSALAAPPGFKVTKEDVSGCTLMLGPAEADGVVPMRAECHWADVPYDKFVRVFSKWEDHDVFFGTISASDVLSVNAGVSQVHQVHVSKGIADREIVLDGTSAPDGDGTKFSWKKSAHQVGASGDRVEVARSEGYWIARPAADGGVDVEHQLSYDPGGSVPGFLVRWFQTSGLSSIVTDLHTYMTTH